MAPVNSIMRGKHVLKILAVNAAILSAGIVIMEFAFGLRGSHSTPDQIDILTVGGSTTDQRYIRDGETWQDILQRHFERAGVPNLVSNAGIDGQSTRGHIKNFSWWFPLIPGLAPEFILLYTGLNDLHIDAGYIYDNLQGERGNSDFLQRVRKDSALLHLATTLRGAWKAMAVKAVHRPVDFKALQWTGRALQDDYRFAQPRIDAYADRLRILADMVYDIGAKPIFVSQPSRQYRVVPQGIEGQSTVSSYDGREINGADYYHTTRSFDDAMGTVASEKGAIYVDLASHAGWEDADFYDFSHMTPRGAEKVGSLLYDALRDIVASSGQR